MSLPPEIHNLIFTECIPDKELMAAWGLVSKDYLVPSRSALFSSVRLDSENDAERFAHILDAPSCDIAVLILRLSLSHQSDESPWFPDVLPRLPAFVNATTLCLEASQWGLRDDMCGVLHASLPRATTLEITNFPFVYYADAIHFACGFVQLQSLSFSRGSHMKIVLSPPCRSQTLCARWRSCAISTSTRIGSSSTSRSRSRRCVSGRSASRIPMLSGEFLRVSAPRSSPSRQSSPITLSKRISSRTTPSYRTQGSGGSS
ncbi:hypothetical protein FB451DRAFT_463481 [Mycena latifolia]|nr:hypothetical protein FB451DRAFT_463481 [Mycena latifolia]